MELNPNTTMVMETDIFGREEGQWTRHVYPDITSIVFQSPSILRKGVLMIVKLKCWEQLPDHVDLKVPRPLLNMFQDVLQLRLLLKIQPGLLATTIRFLEHLRVGNRVLAQLDSFSWRLAEPSVLLLRSLHMVIALAPLGSSTNSEPKSEFAAIALILDDSDGEDAKILPQMILNNLRELDVSSQECFDIAFAVARAWQRSLHEVFAIPRLLAEGERSTKWSEAAEVMGSLKDGHTDSRRWRRIHGYDSQRPSHQVVAVDEEMLKLAKKGDIVQRILNDRNTQTSLKAANLSILDSRRGLKEAHAVGRLTQLAFIFLPLTFITGVFGMNVAPFGGDAPMWKFWTVTTCILVPSWFFGLWVARTEVEFKLQTFLGIFQDLWYYRRYLSRYRKWKFYHYMAQFDRERKHTEKRIAKNKEAEAYLETGAPV